MRDDTDPAVIANDDGRLQAFVVGTNNALYYKTQASPGSSTWSGWTSIGGVIKTDTSPVVARNNDGRLQVFVVGTNNALYYKTQTSPGSNTWSSAWTYLGGGLRDNSDPVVGKNNDGRLEVFRTETVGDIIHGAMVDEYGQETASSAAIQKFNQLAGKNVGVVYFSDRWSNGIQFPSSISQQIKSNGATPFIRMQPSDSYDGHTSSKLTNANIGSWQIRSSDKTVCSGCKGIRTYSHDTVRCRGKWGLVLLE